MALKSQIKNERSEAIEKVFQHELERPNIVGLSAFTFKLFFLVFLTALLGGFLAGFIRDNLLDIYGNSQNQVNNITTDNDKKSEVLDLNFLVKEQDNAYSDVLTKVRAQVVGFYKARPTAGSILDSLYLEKDFLGSGVVATSDGWLLTHQSVLSKTDGVIAVTSDKKVYQLEKSVLDPFSGLVMVKISATGLSPVKFANLSEMPGTQGLIVARYSIQNHGSDLIKNYIRKFGYHDQNKGTDFLLSTERIERYLKMSSPVDSVYNGAAVISDKNEVVGLLFDSGRDVIDLGVPSFYLKSAVNNFLSTSDKILRSSIGLNYLDLTESLGLSNNVTEGRLKGAVLIGDAKRSIPAVVDNSPAAKAGLKAGDVVLKINNEEINERNSLTKLIQDYTPGKEITLTISREGKEQEVKVTLEEL